MTKCSLIPTKADIKKTVVILKSVLSTSTGSYFNILFYFYIVFLGHNSKFYYIRIICEKNILFLQIDAPNKINTQVN